MRFISSLSAALLLTVSVAQADAHNITVGHDATDSSITFTFEDAVEVAPASYFGVSNHKTATLNGEDLGWMVTPSLINDGNNFGNTLLMNYMFFSASISNGFKLPNGLYTVVFEDGFLRIDGIYTFEPITLLFKMLNGVLTGIDEVRADETAAEGAYVDVMGRPVQADHTLRIGADGVRLTR